MIKPEKTFIIRNYDFFLFDIFGVMHDGVNAYKDAIDFVNILLKDKKVIFLSNTPKPSNLSYNKLKELGVKGRFSVITSGDLARIILQRKFHDKLIYHWGEETNSDICNGLSLTLTRDVEKSDLILLTHFIMVWSGAFAT